MRKKILFTTAEACEVLHVRPGASSREIFEAWSRESEKASRGRDDSPGKKKEYWQNRIEEITEARDFLLQFAQIRDGETSRTELPQLQSEEKEKSGSAGSSGFHPYTGKDGAAGAGRIVFPAVLAAAFLLLICWFYQAGKRPSYVENTPSAPPTGIKFSQETIKRDLEEVYNERDGTKLVKIPAGKFIRGSSEGVGGKEEHPVREIYLDDFYIGVFEVTNNQFGRFVDESGYETEGDWRQFFTPERANHPVVNVTWNDAASYCRWAGLRLPTEAEWEKAARGVSGRIYPWGNQWNDVSCNWYGYKGSRGSVPVRGTLPVGSFSSGTFPYGSSYYSCMDMAGNVYEWCSDWYREDYYSGAPEKNPRGPGFGNYRVLRGGSWLNSDPGKLRGAARSYSLPATSKEDVGFRCARKAR
jgi:formylglycine-generating enzyme required for sulfatase activity